MSDEAAEASAAAAAERPAERAGQADRAAPSRQAEAPETAETAETPEEPEFPAVPPPGPTGDPRVDAAVARLGELGGRPVPEHVAIYADVHHRLQELLAAAGQDEPSPPPRPAFPDALRPRP